MESMTTVVLIIGAAALSSSLVTAGAFLAVADRLLRRRVASSTEMAGDVVAAKVRSAVDAAVGGALPRLRSQVGEGVKDGAAEVLPKVRGEVEAGVSDAAEKLLPELRSQISEGLSEALASAVTGGVFGKAGEELVRKGGNVLDLLLGSRDSDRD